MAVSAKRMDDSPVLTITVEGKFDFSDHLDFRHCYESLGQTPEKYVIDLDKTSYLDSSALGMLLLLRDFAGGDQAKIDIINSNADIKKILTISNFQQLFHIQ